MGRQTTIDRPLVNRLISIVDDSAVTRSAISGHAILPPDSEENFGKARAWLNTCISHHPDCSLSLSYEKIREEETPLPTRVINVDPNAQNPPRLIDSNGRRGRYVALSYCWGTTSVVRTLKSTLHEHQQALPFHRLPQTIKDVIMVSRKLGIEYIWVDALCIIQDDDEDWEREAQEMSRVYQYALLTIAATAGYHSDAGLFMNRSAES